MALNSSIEWTQATWNPVTGCSKVSQGCKHCYAERLAKRLQAMGNPRYQNGFAVTLHPDLLDLPLKWSKPRLVFVNSMSDLFHEDVPAEFITAVFETMRKAPHHTFQVLTKRPERARALADTLPWPPNIWLGTSVENMDVASRVGELRGIPATVRFLSCEPLLGPLAGLDLSGVNWVIVGGESGPGHRPMDPSWVMEIRNACHEAGIPFFFKQWGGFNPKAGGRLLEGRTWDAMPASAAPETRGGRRSAVRPI